jgi:hypothetical protein
LDGIVPDDFMLYDIMLYDIVLDAVLLRMRSDRDAEHQQRRNAADGRR